MAREGDVTRPRSEIVIGPLGCYLTDSGRPLADRMASLLALHRVVSGAGFRDPLWTLSGFALRRTLMSRLRAATSLPRRD
jgi:hypothetical protein